MESRMESYKIRGTPSYSPDMRDVSKKVFVLPQILLKMVNIWPPEDNWLTTIAFYVKLTIIVCIELGQLIYFIFNFTDMTKLTSTMSTLSTTLQAIVKMSVIYIYSNRLKRVIKIAYEDFWPSNFLEQTLENELKSTSTLMTTSMISLMCSAVIFAFGFLTKPLIEGNMQLPFDSWYPFTWQKSPYYEIIYIIQIFSNIYIIVISILGHDFFVLALACNVIAQYRLLKNVVKEVGGGSDETYSKTLEGFHGVGEGGWSGREDVQENELLFKCVEHHNKLLMISDEMRDIFASSFFVQLATSVVAICVSSFLITMVEIDKTQIYHLTSYCLGHVLQLFMVCAAGNELSHQSHTFGDYAFGCNWHLKKYTNLRKSLVMIIRRCQRGSKLTAMGIFDLNYNTFVTVMRMSFSFYTLLSNIIEKKVEDD